MLPKYLLPDLFRATLILISDGDDKINIEKIEEAKKGLKEELEIVFHCVSIITENTDIK